MEIRSYRSVFDLERRVYRVDAIRLNPAGVPVRAIAYSLAAIALALVCGRLPGVRTLAAALPWFLRYGLLPIACGWLIGVVRVDGRRFDTAALALLRFALAAERRVSLRAGSGRRLASSWRPQGLLMLPDGSDACLRRLRFSGPGAVRVRVPHECTARGAAAGALGRPLVVMRMPTDRAPAEHRVIVLDGATRLRVC